MMKKLLFLLVLIGYSVVGFGQQDSVFTIEGTVWDEETGEPIGSATVFLIENEVKLDSIKLYENGKFVFEIFRKGCYNLSAKFDGYYEQFSDKCYPFEQGKMQGHNFYLDEYNDIDVINCVFPILYFPDSLKFKTQIIIKDEIGKLIPNTLIWFEPTFMNDYQNVPKHFSDENDGNVVVELGQDIEYNVTILKEDYQPIEEVITITQPIENITITLKKEK